LSLLTEINITAIVSVFKLVSDRQTVPLFAGFSAMFTKEKQEMSAKEILVCTFLVATAISVGASTYKTLHNFDGYDGIGPQAGLIFDQAGNLYGVAPYSMYDYTSGVVFELSPSFGGWNFSILHEFELVDFFADPAGREPIGGLVMDAAGVIYGTNRYQDDVWECGTVFRSSASDWYALHTFTGPDGCNPKSNLRISNGWLVGTTSAGGASGQGTVFFLDTVSGAIHSYSLEGIKAGATAMGNLNVFGYGTTMSGGIYGGGTVYHLGSISKRLEGRYSFKLDGATGYAPMGDLLATYVNGVRTMYGATSAGGRLGGGTVYRLKENPTSPENWQITTLHAFTGTDGKSPLAGLTADAAGNLYGTTSQGGHWGCGTVFKLSPQPDNKWKFTLLYSFNLVNPDTGGDGCSPSSSVVLDAAGNLYGTTRWGGWSDSGTIYEIIP
jgi:uncharacterized repeat protein (TIGR03803 family)